MELKERKLPRIQKKEYTLLVGTIEDCLRAQLVQYDVVACHRE